MKTAHQHTILHRERGTDRQLPQQETISAKLEGKTAVQFIRNPRTSLYVFVFTSWIACLLWFEPRLLQLLSMADGIVGWAALLLLVIFINIAWLYGLYNIAIVLFSIYYRNCEKRSEPSIPLTTTPRVAILYTTCNDFSEQSLLSCTRQDYPDYKVYILDDSSREEYKELVDAFAARYPGLVTIIRRSNRHAFKAGNLNNALAQTNEKYFAIADADEILPPDFLTKTVPALEADDRCAFVQANHRANPGSVNKLSRELGTGIDIHWKWYQPLRNKYGFVMFLGHGAVLRRECWEKTGGFPEIVSEDLGFAIRARELGYRGYFMEEVVCYEDFPESVRAFRVRHMKWTRGTCEFLGKEFKRLVKAKQITWQEKADILFPTLNLPLTLLFFCFMINANLVLPYLFGAGKPVTFVAGNQEYVFYILRLKEGFAVINSLDFYLITLLTFISPVLCFIIALAGQPLRLFRFLAHSTALYAALSPLSSIGVIGYLLTGKASFLVTGEKKTFEMSPVILRSEIIPIPFGKLLGNFLSKSHPDQRSVRMFEIGTGLFFGLVSIVMLQFSFLGLCLAFILLPVMHRLGWENTFVRIAVYIPFVLILAGLLLSGLNIFGMQSTFFGYGFHF